MDWLTFEKAKATIFYGAKIKDNIYDNGLTHQMTKDFLSIMAEFKPLLNRYAFE
jgi:hypothetical protein